MHPQTSPKSAYPAGTLRPLHTWARHHPSRSAFLVLLISYAAYLYSCERVDFLHDSAYYWDLSVQYWKGGQFRLMAFDSILRGYLFPLLLVPLSWFLQFVRWGAVDLVRAVGALMAAGLFGVVGPGLWHTVWQPAGAAPVALSRRLLFGALGFIFWRGYFNYPLTDFPALLALTSGLWIVLRGRSVWSGLLAGLLVAAAANFRPVYSIALPIVGLLLLWPQPAPASGRPALLRTWARRLAFVAGLAVVLWPQAAINQEHFQVSSPWVLTSTPGTPSLYLTQLQWGLEHQKYETNMGTDYPGAQVFFLNPRGQAFWKATGLTIIESYEQYGELILSAPLFFIRSWAGHLFNGLDIQYPTPYIEQVYVATWGLAWLNYTIWFGALWVLGSRLVRRGFAMRPVLVGSALLLPVAATLPTIVECRFLLPLHLLLCAAVAFGARPVRAWQRLAGWQRGLSAALYVGFVLMCFSLSTNAQSHLAMGPRYLFDWQKPGSQP